MSLLLDALKRAEQEKLARQAQEPYAAPPPPEAAAHRVPSAAAEAAAHAAPSATETAARPAPSAAEAAARRLLELEPHEPGEATASSASASASAPAAAKHERDSAKAVFAAKQAAPAAAAASGRKKAIVAIAAGTVVAILAGGGYVWYEIARVSGPAIRGPLPVSAPRPVTPAAPQAVAGAPSPLAGAPAQAAPGRPDAVPPVTMLKPGDGPASASRAKPQPKAAEQLVMSLLKDSADAKPAPPLKLSRTIDPPRVSPDVARGYDALRRGDAAEARKAYEAALAVDPANLDAHLGLATAAARAGDRDTATRHYRRALSLDPKNPTAVAGLAALADLSRPEGLEEQLRADITRYPQSAALHFTLGNLYASQSRWNEAQAAYFEAYRLDPDSADLAYNLAVSLDHLGQARLAADFYQRALAAARKQAAQFDKGQVTRRIAELKP